MDWATMAQGVGALVAIILAMGGISGTTFKLLFASSMSERDAVRAAKTAEYDARMTALDLAIQKQEADRHAFEADMERRKEHTKNNLQAAINGLADKQDRQQSMVEDTVRRVIKVEGAIESFADTLKRLERHSEQSTVTQAQIVKALEKLNDRDD